MPKKKLSTLDREELESSFEVFFTQYPNPANRVAAKRFWMTTLRPLPQSKLFTEIMDGLEAFLEQGPGRFPPNAVKFLLDNRWKDPLPPTVRQLTRDYQADPLKFLTEHYEAFMKCSQRGWGSVPTPRQEALARMHVPVAWWTANNFRTVDVVRH